MISLLTATIVLTSSQTPTRIYNGKLGQFYTIGEVARVIGTGERLNFNLQRQIKMNGVRTTLAVGTYLENVVAPAGKQLILLEATIRNHQSGNITVGTAEAYGLRIFDASLSGNDVIYAGSFSTSFGELKKTLRKGESVDLVSIYICPETMPLLRIAPFFKRYYAKDSPHYDLTKLVPSSKSIFGKGPLAHGSKATSQVDVTFDFEELNIRVLGSKPIDEGGIGVQVELTTNMQKPVPWGWQYAKAELIDADGQTVTAYPAFYQLPSNGFGAVDVKRGSKVMGEYRFYPKGSFVPKEFRLTKVPTERRVTVGGL